MTGYKRIERADELKRLLTHPKIRVTLSAEEIERAGGEAAIDARVDEIEARWKERDYTTPAEIWERLYLLGHRLPPKLVAVLVATLRTQLHRFDEAAEYADEMLTPLTGGVELKDAGERDRWRKAVTLLTPAPSDEDACRAQVEAALDIVDDARRREYRQPTKEDYERFDDALRRFKPECHDAARAGVALPMSIKSIDDIVTFNEKWNRGGPSPLMKSLSPGWKPANRAHDLTAGQIAVELAYDLLTDWKQPTPISRNGRWHRLATILLGDPDADLFRQLRRVAEIRRHPK